MKDVPSAQARSSALLSLTWHWLPHTGLYFASLVTLIIALQTNQQTEIYPWWLFTFLTCFNASQTLAFWTSFCCSPLLGLNSVPSSCGPDRKIEHSMLGVLCSPLKDFPGPSWLSSPPSLDHRSFSPSSDNLCLHLPFQHLASHYHVLSNFKLWLVLWAARCNHAELSWWLRTGWAMLTAQNFHSHPDSPGDPLLRTPTQGRAGLGP